MKLKSIIEYAADVGIQPRSVLKQIHEGRLPEGVKAKMVGDMGYVIIIRKKKKTNTDEQKSETKSK